VANQTVTVPDIGGGEAEVIELLVAVGDQVEVDQGLVVLESDKASMEIPSSVAGTVVELLVSEGQELAEGAAVVVVDAEGEVDAPEPDAPAAAATVAPEPEVEAAPEQTVSPEPAAGPILVDVPDIGTEDAVDLIEICVAVGDSVSEGDSLVVLESDKASMEVPAPFDGEVLEIKVEEGGSVKQGDPLMVMRGTVAAAATEAAPVAAPAAAPSPAPVVSAQPAPPQQAPSVEPAGSTGSVYAGPAVRKLAREFGIPLQEVKGSGPRGRLLKEDLHGFVKQRLEAPAATAGSGSGIPQIPDIDFSAFGEVEIVSRSKLDKLTAANMQRSWLNVPHVTQYDDADITELEAFRTGLKAEAEQRGTRLTPLPFLLKAVAVALRDNPKFRTSLADGGESLVYKQFTHIGMAVDTPAGLVVPVIRDVDSKSIWDIAEEVIEMAGKARDRKLKPSDMQGGCFTISSLGNIGGNGFTPIVNAPEVGILGVSRAQMKPVWDGQAFAPRKMLPLSLSYDHRVINGGDGGRFLTQLVTLLGDIRQLIL
jgi:pyruvate dehydrogenase E2 component (dihydrolipoyllysine-residue acetyltransferase)